MQNTLVRRAATTAFLVSMLALSACASTARTEGTGQYVDDTVITTKVKAAVLDYLMLKLPRSTSRPSRGGCNEWLRQLAGRHQPGRQAARRPALSPGDQ